MTYPKILFLAAALLVACQTAPEQTREPADTPASDNEELTLEQVCSEYPCRENIRISFMTENGPVDQTLALYWPRVLDDVISVLPGESFFVEADLIDGRLMDLVEVPENSNPTKTITIKFSQMDDEVGMILSLHNPFQEVALKFNMDMIDFNGDAHQTSSCPVMPGISIYEAWPHAIPELIISNPIAIAAKDMDSVSCVY